jgi:site-specific recombinase XerD
MFQELLTSATALRRHKDAPFAAERERYLQHCLDAGATCGSLRVKHNELLWAAKLLDADAPCGIDSEKLKTIVARRTAIHNSPTTEQRFIDITRPWLKFLGWWKERTEVCEYQYVLDQYCRWMHDELGFAGSTIAHCRDCVRYFLKWCSTTGLKFHLLKPRDIDSYFIDESAHRWNRVTVATVAGVLRIFLRYAATQGWCDPRVAQTIRGPRIYKQESLPFAPDWVDVQRILVEALTDEPRDVRDRAILMLLSIYGMRASEVTSLRLDQVDWQHHAIRFFRLKRRQPQVYPLLPSVAEALARYIDIIRPSTSYAEVFIGLNSPHRPLTRSAIYAIVSPRLLAAGIEVVHRGPHALRHACATRLIAERFSLKEIGDHLGHRSTSAVRTYAKIDLEALHEVGNFDLGDLQ